MTKDIESAKKKLEPNPIQPPEATEEGDDAIIGRALLWSLIFIVPLVAGVVVAVWWYTRPAPEPPPHSTELVAARRRDAPQRKPPKVEFRDITHDVGIDFVHVNGAVGDKLLPETMGGGVAFLDYDNDGDADLLFVNSCHWPDTPPTGEPDPIMCLYSNDGTGRFENATASSGLDVTMYGMGAAVGDFDNDGWVDVFLSALGPNRLFHNDHGKFVDVTDDAGVAGDDAQWSTTSAFFDYDNDGLLDLFVCNYLAWSKEYDQSQGFSLLGGGRAYGRPQNFAGTFPYLYHNEGNGKFTDVSMQAGVQVTNPPRNVPAGKSLGLAIVDIDGDGWLDVLVANDTVPKFLFHNLGNGTFQEVGKRSGVAFDAEGKATGAMGTDVAWIRNDDSLGVAIGNFSKEMTALYVTQGKGNLFSDEAVASGLGPPTRLELTFGVFFFDYDLDGRIDLLSANGHLEADINRVEPTQTYAQMAQLFWNAGPDQKTEFVQVGPEQVGADFHEPLVGRGAAFADIDGDGDLDIVMTAVGGSPRLLRNEQKLGHHWLRFRLVGTTSNRDAIGAVVEVHVEGHVQRRQVMPTRSYISQVELPVTFGLGESDKVDNVVVKWPDGTQQELTDLEVDKTHIVTQPGKTD